MLLGREDYLYSYHRLLYNTDGRATNQRLNKGSQFVFSILAHTIHYTLSDSAFIKVFGYKESGSTGPICEVRGIVLLQFRRHLMMTLPQFG